ncbi:helix-turn-helix domain-containing protein [Alkaliphilus sp. B6464]|uniref:helix-turn-helix domain-containing protein n=1 Tax=Alkaliphilus sp. B6464 TaxID=2731219 RepID=UPI001BA5E910|nr:helix-turn-helix domain-containing protein [Alkaliphilus sp. B6464]QUH20219.1 LacI family DNA-binding transcriptional regulator [Alkaliphilus sp. B6464]
MNERIEYKLERIRKKIKLKDVAKEIGISTGTVSRYENNKREMTEEHIQKYKKYIEEN